MNNTPLRIGVIGCGIMGNNHARVAKEAPSLELFAVADVREEAAKKVAAEHGAPNVYASAEALLDNKDVEAVVIALPTAIRTPIALRAFGAGKHVLVEKPVALNAGEVKRMIAARGDRVGAVCSCRYRYFDSARAAAETFASGKLGKLRMVRFRGVRPDGGPMKNAPPPWRVSHKLNGGGIFVNWGCYDLDYVMGITGWSLRPRRVFAMNWPAPDRPKRVDPASDAETHAIALIQCEDDIALSIERGEFMSMVREESWQIIGHDGTLRLQMMPDKQGDKLFLDQAHADKPLTTETIYEGVQDMWTAHRAPLEDLANAVRNKTSPLTSLENGLVMQQITDAIYESARTGKAVDIA